MRLGPPGDLFFAVSGSESAYCIRMPLIPICSRFSATELEALDRFAARLGVTRSKAQRIALAVAEEAPPKTLLAARNALPLDRWRPGPHQLDVEEIASG